MNTYADELYLDKVKLMKLRTRVQTLPDEALPDLRILLDHVTHIISTTRSSKNLTDGIEIAKLQAGDGSLSSRSSATWQLWASKIGRAMAFQDEDSIPEDKTWLILDKYQELPLKAMAILSLVAFTTMYGKARLVASSSGGLATSIASFGQIPPGTDKAFNQWLHALSKLLDRTLKVANQVLVLEESPVAPVAGHDANRLLLPSAVHKIISVIFVCWKLVVDIMIKRSWAELQTSLVKFGSCKWKLENKLREFKLEDPIEQPQADRVHEFERQSCWWKLRQLLNGTCVKSKAQPKLSYTTTQLSLHRYIMHSTTQGALKGDDDDDDA